MGYEPQPAPGPPTLAYPFWWWGDTVQFAASYLDPIAPANLTFFNRMSANASQVQIPSGSDYANTATFTIPSDARSSLPATIQAHARMSPGSSAVVLTPGLSYTNLHGVVWAPQTGNVWVASDSKVDEVNLFLDGPVSTTWVTGIDHPYISRVSDNGTLLVVDSSLGVATIYQIDVNSGTESVFAQTKDDGFTRNILPVGIGLSADGLVGYIADASSGRVVRIPAGAGPGSTTITDSWGGKDDFVFPDPAPIDVAPTSQTLVGDTGDQGSGWVWVCPVRWTEHQ